MTVKRQNTVAAIEALPAALADFAKHLSPTFGEESTDDQSNVEILGVKRHNVLMPRRITDQTTIPDVDDLSSAILRRIELATQLLNSSDFKDFPGCRRLGLPLKIAVELFIRINHPTKISGATLADFVTFPKLYNALQEYRRFEKHLPFDIKTTHELAKERFESVVACGLDKAPRRDRDAAHKYTKRRASVSPK